MPFEMLVGLHVIDRGLYQEYRSAMGPMLEAAGGGFRYDFEVGATLRSEAGHPITRLFALYFPDRKARDAFFADAHYQDVKARFFAKAVRGTTVLAEYER
jgi:uncharacterized protein (DUF1330 family)